MDRLLAALFFSSGVFAQTAQDAGIAAAAKSPVILARYVESHNTIDWKTLRRTLGLKVSQSWLAPCGGDFPAAESPCSAETVILANPDQAIVIIRGGDLSYTVEYLRYLEDSETGWHFAGENSAFKKEGPSYHEVMRVGGKPFLKISSNHSQYGASVFQEIEDWFDLTQPDLEPVFSFTADGGEGRFSMGVGRSIHAHCTFSQTTGIERIDLILSVHFNGLGLNLEAMYLGVYDRRPNEKKFVLRNAYSGLDRRGLIATKDFEELADPLSGLSNEKLLAYALPGLQKIAEGSDLMARDWLKSVLKNAQDTPEKRMLIDLLAKRP
jgi:hypothetical protein